jgi:hypothetical protein
MTDTGRGAPAAREKETDFTRTYVLVVAIELAVIAALYWFGRHFS